MESNLRRDRKKEDLEQMQQQIATDRELWYQHGKGTMVHGATGGQDETGDRRGDRVRVNWGARALEARCTERRSSGTATGPETGATMQELKQMKVGKVEESRYCARRSGPGVRDEED